MHISTGPKGHRYCRQRNIVQGNNVRLSLLQGQSSLRLDMIVRRKVPVTSIASHSDLFLSVLQAVWSMTSEESLCLMTTDGS